MAFKVVEVRGRGKYIKPGVQIAPGNAKTATGWGAKSQNEKRKNMYELKID